MPLCSIYGVPQLEIASNSSDPLKVSDFVRAKQRSH